MSRAFVFPGQGSQEVGMGRELSEAFTVARLVFEEIDDALGQKLSSIIFNGPGEELILTENAQPALMAVSIAVIRVLEEQGNIRIAQKATYVAGQMQRVYLRHEAKRCKLPCLWDKVQWQPYLVLI